MALAEKDSMTLRFAQLVTQFADNMKFQIRISPKPTFYRARRHPIPGYGSYRLRRVHISSFLGQPEQIIGEQEGKDVLCPIRQSPVGLRYPADDIEDGIGAIPFSVDAVSLLEADYRRDDRELRTFLIRKQMSSVAIRGAP
jgi:hypothetical protein